MRQSLFYCSIFSNAGKFYLAHGLRQLTRDVKREIRILSFISDVNTKTLIDVQKRSLCDVKFNNNNNNKIEWYLTIFSTIGMKNNQILVFDTDRDIPTLGSTVNAGNSVNLVAGIIRSPSGRNSRETSALGSTDNAGNSSIIRSPSDWDFSVFIGDRC